MKSFKYGNLVAELGKVACTGQSGGAGTYDSDFVSVEGSGFGLLVAVIPVPVSDESLKTADSYGLAFDSADALGFALCLLRAYTSADCGEGRSLVDDLICTLEISLFDLIDEFGDMYIDRAAGHAGHILAVQAALRLIKSDLFAVADGNFVEVVGTDQRILRGHRVLGKTHVRHIILPP